MELKSFRKISLSKNIVFLVSLNLAIFFSFAVFIIISYSNHLKEMEQVIGRGEVYSLKMQLNSELMELARARSRITLQIVDTEDVFEQDELNLELGLLAGRFAAVRSRLLNMPLTAEEKALYDQHNTIVPIILPAQREAVSLSMSGIETDRLKARNVVYDTVLPGQGRMIDSLGALVKLEQRYIAKLAQESQHSVNKMQTQNNWLSVATVILITLLAIILITRIRKIQNQLVNTNEVLEKRVEERTADAINARDEAENANRLKSDFLANMSHEIRTPLNAIVNLSQLALKRDIDDQAREFIEKLASSGKDLSSIINDILDFSKIEAGKLQIESISFSLSDLCKNTVEIFSGLADDKDISLLYKLPDTLNTNFMGDPLRLGQILNNLISNAIKFTSQGEVILLVNELSRDNNSSHLNFCVIDTGIGLNNEQVKNLFESFQQADSTTTRKYGGTGLGLTISKQLVELMGGNISVTSEPDKGSQFCFTLKLESDTETEAIPDNTQNQDILQHKVSGKTVLLVEDNEVNQLIAQTILAEINIEVVTANNGIEALEQLQENDFDIVFMDIQMPEMDGYETTMNIRKLYGNNLPIIAMTANAMKEDIDRCIEAGMNSHIAKPVEVEKIYKALCQYL